MVLLVGVWGLVHVKQLHCCSLCPFTSPAVSACCRTAAGLVSTTVTKKAALCGWATAQVQPTPAGTLKIQTTMKARKTVSARLEKRASGMMRPAQIKGCLCVRLRSPASVEPAGCAYTLCCWAVLACPQLHDCATPCNSAFCTITAQPQSLAFFSIFAHQRFACLLPVLMRLLCST